MNSLQLVFINRVPKPVAAVPDKSYRILVTLIRSDRPRYWNYLCSNCGSKVMELQNYDVIANDDFYDPQNAQNAAVGRHCKGSIDGLPCPYHYFFKLG